MRIGRIQNIVKLAYVENGPYEFRTKGGILFTRAGDLFTLHDITTKQNYQYLYSEIKTLTNEAAGVDADAVETYIINALSLQGFVIPPADTIAPTVPGTPATTSKTTNSITISWTGSTDTESGVKEYQIFVDGTREFLVAIPATSATIAGLQADESYDIQVSAIDFAGNESARSGTLTETTDALPGGGTATGYNHNPVIIPASAPGWKSSPTDEWTEAELRQLAQEQNGHANDWPIQSTDPNVHAIVNLASSFKYRGAEMTVHSAADGYYSTVGDGYHDVQNINFIGIPFSERSPLSPSGTMMGRAVSILNAQTAIVKHNRFEHIRGARVKNSRDGARVEVEYNDGFFLEGRQTDGAGGYFYGALGAEGNTHLIGMRNGRNLTGFIRRNRVINRVYDPGDLYPNYGVKIGDWRYQPETQDQINFDAGGNESERFAIYENLIVGEYPYTIPYNHATDAGNGEMTSIGSGMIVDSPNFNYANGSDCWGVDYHDNYLVNCTNNLIAISKWAVLNTPNPTPATAPVRVYDNYAVSTGTLADYSARIYSSAGLNCLFTGKNVEAPGHPLMVEIYGNHVACTNSRYGGGGGLHYQVQNGNPYKNEWLSYLAANNDSVIDSEDLSSAGNENLASPEITLEHEQWVIDQWDALVTAGSWVIGPNAGGAPASSVPIITATSNQASEEGGVISLQITATDSNGDTLTYGATGLPTGLSINASSGLITGTISAGANTSSPFSTVITVTDDETPPQQAQDSFTWSVVEDTATVAADLTETWDYTVGNAVADETTTWKNSGNNLFKVSTSNTYSGAAKSAHVYVDAEDTAGTGNNYRCELAANGDYGNNYPGLVKHMDYGSIWWFGFTIYVPSGWQNELKEEIVWQFHSADFFPARNPMISLAVDGSTDSNPGKFRIYQKSTNIPDSTNYQTALETVLDVGPADYIGQHIKIVARIMWGYEASGTGSGDTQIWINDTLKYDKQGVGNCYNDAGTGPYMKIGLYNWPFRTASNVTASITAGTTIREYYYGALRIHSVPDPDTNNDDLIGYQIVEPRATVTANTEFHDLPSLVAELPASDQTGWTFISGSLVDTAKGRNDATTYDVDATDGWDTDGGTDYIRCNANANDLVLSNYPDMGDDAFDLIFVGEWAAWNNSYNHFDFGSGDLVRLRENQMRFLINGNTSALFWPSNLPTGTLIAARASRTAAGEVSAEWTSDGDTWTAATSTATGQTNDLAGITGYRANVNAEIHNLIVYDTKHTGSDETDLKAIIKTKYFTP